MVDEIKNIDPTSVVASVATDATAPKSEVVDKPVVTEEAAPVVTEPTPTVENKEVKDALVESEIKSETSTILAQVAKEAKPQEVKPVEEEQKNESNLTDEPAPLPEYEPFTLPEGWSIDDTKLGEFNNLLAEFEVKNKANHAEVQALGQKMIDKYVADIQRIQDTSNQEVSKIRSEWKEAFEKDPELGGNRLETTKNILVEAVKSYSGSPEQVQAFGEFVEQTGIGDNPDLARLIVNQQKAIQYYKNKYESEADVKILAGTKPEIVNEKVWHKLYGNSAG